MKLASTVCIITLLVITSAHGADAGGRFAIKGAGLASCQDYVEARAKKSEFVYSMLGWLDGYLTAYNQLSPSTFDVAAWESADLFARILDSHCEKHPQDRLFTVFRAIVDQVMEDRLQMNSPLIPARNHEQGLLIYQETLRRVQEELSARGHFSGEIDGQFRDSTRDALKAYQSEQGLDVSELPDQATLWKLFRPSPKP